MVLYESPGVSLPVKKKKKKKLKKENSGFLIVNIDFIGLEPGCQ
jgi:hypothetical protein